MSNVAYGPNKWLPAYFWQSQTNIKFSKFQWFLEWVIQIGFMIQDKSLSNTPYSSLIKIGCFVSKGNIFLQNNLIYDKFPQKMLILNM